MSIIHNGLITQLPVRKGRGGRRAWLVINGLLRSSTQAPSCKCALSLVCSFLTLLLLFPSLSLCCLLSCLSLVNEGFLSGKHIKALRCVVENSKAHSTEKNRHTQTQAAFASNCGRCCDVISNSCSWRIRVQFTK